MAKTTWGRKETIIWPHNRPIYTYVAIFSAMILTVVFVYGWLRFLTKPLQWFYAPVYVRTSVFGTFSRTHRSEYRMLFLTGHGLKPGPVMNGDVVHGKTLEPGGRVIPLALSVTALQRGNDLLFRGPVRSYVDARLHEYLKAAVYDGRDVSAILKPPLLCGAGVFLILLPFAVTLGREAPKSAEVWTEVERP